MNANFEERMAKIKAHAVAEENKKRSIAEAEERHHEELKESIKAMAPRIANLLDLANACVKNGVEPYKAESGVTVGSTTNRLEADGFFHWLGFNCYFNHTMRSKEEITELAIINGGACGNTDLRVGRNGIAKGYIEKSYYHDGGYTEPRTRDMEKFLKQFDEFEEMVLNFVDNL